MKLNGIDMKQTAVEWLMEQMKDDRFLSAFEEIINQAKELEKQQLRIAWDSSEQNMRSTFSSSQYKGIKFEEWLKKIRL